jgi:hypothetical protein
MALADRERRGLAAETRPALVHVALVARLGKPVTSHEAGHAGPDHRDLHGLSPRSKFAFESTR